MAEKLHLDEDDKESLSCGICLEFYDSETRVPKFLQCFHTCCLTCLKSQTKNQKIECPYCRKTTPMKNKSADQLTTNFYILPKVHKLGQFRKRLEDSRLKTKNNWAESIALRRIVESKLKTVHDASRLVESMLTQKCEENNEKIVILQSLIEEPTITDLDELVLKDKKCEAELEDSEKELSNAQQLNDTLLDVEKYSCDLVLQDQSGQRFSFENLHMQRLSFSSKSAEHGPYVGAAQSLLSFIIYHMKESNLLRPMENEIRTSVGSLQPENTENLDPSAVSLDLGAEALSSDADSVDADGVYAYLQFRVNGTVKPIVVLLLDMEEAPLMSQTFLEHCRGVNNLTYKGTRIVRSGDSIIGGNFRELKPVKGGVSRGKEQELRYVADLSSLNESKGAIRMRHRGRSGQGVYVNTEFSIICNEDHLNTDQMTTVFGHVTRGMEVCEEISQLNPEATDIIIYACGSWPLEQS